MTPLTLSPAAIVFDFDGVVVDSEKYWDAGTVVAYQEMIPSWTAEDDRMLKGRNVHDIYGILVRDYGFTLPKEAYLRHIDAFATRIYAQHTALMDGVVELLARCRERGLPTAVASSSERRWIDIALERLGLDDTFDPVVTARDVGVGKPDPAVYREACRLLGLPPERCLAIEDSKNGIASAKAAGMICIGLRHVDGAYADDISQADWIVETLTEITL